MESRDYQIRAMARVKASLTLNPILVLPTGGGKTFTASRIVLDLGVPTLWIAHRTELIRQAERTLRQLGLPTTAICASYTHVPNPPWLPKEPMVYVASVQTLARRQVPDVELVVIDECHHVTPTGQYFDIIKAAAAPMIGLTATPFRLDGKGLGDAGFGEIIVGAYTDELCADGTLHKPKVYAGLLPDLSNVKVQRGDYEVGAAAEAMMKREIVGDTVEMWKRYAFGMRTLGYAVNVSHSMMEVEAFRDAGISAAHLDGTTPPDKRAQILRDVASGEVLVVWNCQVLTEGVDIPELEAVIIASPTESLCRHLQVIGRVMRTCNGKDGAIILDHAGNHHRHGMATRRIEYQLGSKTKAQQADTLGLRQCKACKFLFDPTMDDCCPECGWCPETAAGRKSTENVQGELYEFIEGHDYKALVYDRLVQTREFHGYADGWVAHKYKERFGEWPIVAFGRLVDPAHATVAQKEAVYRQLYQVAISRGMKPGWASYRYRDTFGCWPTGFVSNVRMESLQDRLVEHGR